ncbi:MAG: hypothetical protein JWM57_3273 [Phycisphaerales bacterium]|nr:hypothetical protein [Phycisphaerales bacterium]
MAILPVNIARVSNQLRTSVGLSAIQTQQAALLKVQNELATGRKLNTPSDNPGDAAMAAQIRKTLEQRMSFSDNLDASNNQLSAVDTSLGNITDLLQQSQTLASANVGDDVTQDARNAAADQLDSIYSQMMDVGNTSFEGSYLFAGDKLDKAPFETFAGGTRFVGSETTLSNQVDESTDASFQVDGANVFGALSTKIEGKTTLGPTVTASTRLSDLDGATNGGIHKGSISIGNGTTLAKIDLNSADTLGDVATAINNAGLGSVTASVTSGGLQITGGGGESLTVNDIAGGTAAADLGISTPTTPGAGVAINALPTNAKVTLLTPLADLNGGAGIDTSGLKITNGGKTATVDLSTATTVQDLVNAVNGSGTGVRMDINADGNGLRLLNTTQGADLNVSENGGTTAADLGLRSFDGNTALADMNKGDGVRTVTGADFTITDSNGVNTDIDLTDTTKTAQDVIDTINASGASVTASFATNGNGIVLTDTAGGGGTLKVTSKNSSQAAADLGIDSPAVSGVITGKDVNPVVAQGVFANIDSLRTALRSGDKQAITKAAEGLQGDYDRVVRSRGEVGARVKAAQSRSDRMDEQNVATKALLSKLEDTDFTEAASQYSLLQTSLQAAMQTTGQMMKLSLMDYLS